MIHCKGSSWLAGLTFLGNLHGCVSLFGGISPPPAMSAVQIFCGANSINLASLPKPSFGSGRRSSTRRSPDMRVARMKAHFSPSESLLGVDVNPREGFFCRLLLFLVHGLLCIILGGFLLPRQPRKSGLP